MNIYSYGYSFRFMKESQGTSGTEGNQSQMSKLKEITDIREKLNEILNNQYSMFNKV